MAAAPKVKGHWHFSCSRRFNLVVCGKFCGLLKQKFSFSHFVGKCVNCQNSPQNGRQAVGSVAIHPIITVQLPLDLVVCFGFVCRRFLAVWCLDLGGGGGRSHLFSVFWWVFAHEVGVKFLFKGVVKQKYCKKYPVASVSDWQPNIFVSVKSLVKIPPKNTKQIQLLF